jgi:hypothetical protein
MNGRRARRRVLDTAESVIQFAANAANWAPRTKILLLGAFAALSVIVAVPILFQADMPPAAADSTLKCYDSAGNYAPCLTRASAAPSRSNGRTTWTIRPPTWATTALYTTTALYQESSWTTPAVDQPANSPSAPEARRSSKPGKRLALAACGRRLIPCVFSTLRRGLTHIASVAAIMGRARPAREHL